MHAGDFQCRLFEIDKSAGKSTSGMDKFGSVIKMRFRRVMKGMQLDCCTSVQANSSIDLSTLRFY
jgi:hypothetical protein